jgi:hypothetical protein
MAEDSKTIILPDNQNNGWGNVPFAMTLPLYGGYGYGNGFGNGLFGGGGFGAGILGGILGGLIPGFFGGWGNGFGWGGNGNGGAAAASLGAQATANANSEMIMNAINGTDADVRLLATTLNSDIDSVRLAINTVQGAVQQVGSTVGLTGQQVINAIQQGDAALASQLCQCCCQTQQQIMAQGYENQIRTVEQTNTLGNAINFNGQRNVDAIADLKTTMVKEFCDLKERDMQEKINSLTANNTLLRSQIDNAAQTATIAGLIAPVAKEVDDIKCKLPSTTSVVWPNLTAVNTTPYVNGGFYGNSWSGYGGFSGNGLFF